MSVRRRTLLKVIVLGDSGYVLRAYKYLLTTNVRIYIFADTDDFSLGFQGWQNIVDESVSSQVYWLICVIRMSDTYIQIFSMFIDLYNSPFSFSIIYIACLFLDAFSLTIWLVI